jgi:T5orf172 domain
MPSYVYVISGPHGLSKIGVTTNPTARLAALQTGSGFPISFSYLMSVASTRGAYAVEQRAHAALSRNRVAGEWFDVAPDDAVAAVKDAAAALGEALQAIESASPRLGPLWRLLLFGPKALFYCAVALTIMAAGTLALVGVDGLDVGTFLAAAVMVILACFGVALWEAI